jgi:lysophospholipase L1-like esterase
MDFTVTAAFVIGGGFSTDGVHPLSQGYAMIANLLKPLMRLTVQI